jgi:hypothetical protein
MRIVKALIIFFIALVAFVRYAPEDGRNPQHITRTALAVAMTDGRLDIDRFAPLTVDKAEHDGRFYADKPPGLSLLAVPAVALARQAMAAAGHDDPDDIVVFVRYVTVATVSTVSLLAALATAVLYLFVRRLGAGDAAAVFASAALALGTPFFGWSATFFAHAATGSLLLFAVAIVGWSERTSPRRALATGLVLGLLMVVDLTAAPAAMLIGAWAVARSAGRMGAITGLLAGGAIGIAPLLVYNALAFGAPFRLGYAQVVGFEGMRSGLFGVSVPDPVVLGELLFGHYRGLLPMAPVLLVVPFGLVAMWKAGRRGLTAVVAGTVLSYLLINSGYHYWDGGSSTGPRHLVAMLPLAAVALAFAWPEGRARQAIALLLLAVSLVLSLVAASTEMFANADYANPLTEVLLPQFLTPGGLMYAAPVVLHWLAFAALPLLRERSGTERYQLAA